VSCSSWYDPPSLRRLNIASMWHFLTFMALCLACDSSVLVRHAACLRSSYACCQMQDMQGGIEACRIVFATIGGNKHALSCSWLKKTLERCKSLLQRNCWVASKGCSLSKNSTKKCPQARYDNIQICATPAIHSSVYANFQVYSLFASAFEFWSLGCGE